MGLSEKDIDRLGPAARAQIAAALNHAAARKETLPDFFIVYKNGSVEVVEVKSKAVRRLQGSYVYRRRLFIELFARPNGWKFTEAIF